MYIYVNTVDIVILFYEFGGILMRKIAVIAVFVICILVGTHSDNKKSINYQKQSSEMVYQSQLGYNNKEKKDAALEAKTKNMQYIFPIEDPVRAKAGKDKFLVKVAIKEQKVYVYKNDIKIKIMDCSTGVDGVDSDTPVDNYKINSYYGQSFYSNKYKRGCKILGRI